MRKFLIIGEANVLLSRFSVLMKKQIVSTQCQSKRKWNSTLWKGKLWQIGVRTGYTMGKHLFSKSVFFLLLLLLLRPDTARLKTIEEHRCDLLTQSSVKNPENNIWPNSKQWVKITHSLKHVITSLTLNAVWQVLTVSAGWMRLIICIKIHSTRNPVKLVHPNS